MFLAKSRNGRTAGYARIYIYVVCVCICVTCGTERPTHIAVGVGIHVLRFGRRLLGTTFSRLSLALADSRRDAEERRMSEFSRLRDGRGKKRTSPHTRTNGL